MRELNERESALLARARHALSPAPDDEARVLEAVERTIAADVRTAGDGASDLEHAPQRAAGAGLWRRSLRTQTGIGKWLTRLALATSVAGSSATLGYRLGFEAGRETASHDPQAVARPNTAKVPPRASTAERRESFEKPMLPQGPSRARSEPGAAARAPERERTPARSEANTITTQPSAQAPTPAESLQRELELVRQVERALREREPGRALELLDQLDSELPEGRLLQERAAATTMARCALGLGRRRLLVEEFSERHPESMYLERVQRSCASRE